MMFENRLRSHMVDRLLARLSRVTSSGMFVPEIDGLRFFAVIAVLFFHIAGFLRAKDPVSSYNLEGSLFGQLFDKGWFGVELFFVISGFILALPFAASLLTQADSAPSLKRYYARRVLRLEPPYFINMLLFFAFWIIIKDARAEELLPHLFASLIYAHNIVYDSSSLINGVAWSLEVEIQFYILAPFIAQVYRVHNRLLRIATFVILPVAVGIAAQALGILRRHNLTGSLQYFIMGFLLVDLFLIDYQGKPQQCYRWDVIGSAAWVLIALCLLGIVPYATYCLPLLILTAYIGAFRGVIWNAVVRNRWLVTIGGMCYTIYLYHYLIVSAVGRVTVKFGVPQFPVLHMVLQFLILFLSVFVICSVFFVLFEKPFMYKNWPARWRTVFLGRLVVLQRGSASEKPNIG